MAKPSESWRELLANPGPDAHIVQLYQEPEFYAEAVTHFAAEGLVRGESIIFVATGPNWNALSSRMSRKGFDVEDLQRQGRLTVLDAERTLPKFIRNNMPDAPAFKTITRSAIQKARKDGAYPRVRWWGEMVNVLYAEGNGKGSTRLEELFDEVAHEEEVAIFCSFLMDKFDRNIYDGPLADVCRTHRSLIPAQDESLHRNCVDRAVLDVFGELQGSFLRAIASSHSAKAPDAKASRMPASQEMLLAIKHGAPDKFDEVLTAARRREQDARGGGGHA